MRRIPIDANGRQYVPDQWVEIPGKITLQQVRPHEDPEELAVYYRSNSQSRVEENKLVTESYVTLVAVPTKNRLKDGSLRYTDIEVSGVTPKRSDYTHSITGLLEWVSFLIGFMSAKAATMNRAEAEVLARATLRLYWSDRKVNDLRKEASRLREEIILPLGLSREQALEVVLEELSELSFTELLDELRTLSAG